MALNSTGIATAIAALSVSGVNMKNLGAVGDVISAAECPVFIPDEDNWLISAVGGDEGEGQATFGAPNGTPYWEFMRTYGYLYLHTITGLDGSMAPYLSAISGKLDFIVTALITLNVTDVDVMQIEVGQLGEYTDGNKNSFYGCRVAVTVKERINA